MRLEQELSEKLDYCPETGAIRWLQRPLSDFATKAAWKRWNTLFAGKAAGTFQNGSIKVNFQNKCYQASRIAWLQVTKESLEAGQVLMFKDGNPCNLRFSNLELITRAECSRRTVLKHGTWAIGRRAIPDRRAASE